MWKPKQISQLLLVLVTCDYKHIYKVRHLVKNAFLHFKRWRVLATRYAKTTASFTIANLYKSGKTPQEKGGVAIILKIDCCTRLK